MVNRRRRRIVAPRVTCVLLLAALLVGCGRGRGNVSGTVRFKGQALQAGTITFYDVDQGVTSDAIKPDGSYTVRGVPTGEVKITVAVPLNISFGSESLPGVKLSVGPAIKTPAIPPRYLDAAQSGLTYEVVAGDQTHDVELTP